MIEKRPFGRTDHMSSRTIFGAAAFFNANQAEADQALDILLEYGINHIDTAASYGDSELRVGPWMKQHRQDFFLATKTGERTYEAARDEFYRSLERLQVDSVDLLQLHSLSHPDEWDVAMGPGGALEAAIEARDKGLIRFIGVTGHGWTIPVMHQRSLARFDFDSVLLPYNYVMMQNEKYRQDFETLEQICLKRNVAMQTIKSIARGPWATGERNRTTWYQPLETQEDINQAVHWVLSRPNVFLNTAGDLSLLPKILQAASEKEEAPTLIQMQDLMKARQLTSLFGIS
ncbi:MAG: aldo/keto reductase [Chloroflexota bacterium]